MSNPHRPATPDPERSHGDWRQPADVPAPDNELQPSDEIEPPPRLDPNNEHLHDHVEHSAKLLCCLDFDGTLAPIVSEPTDAALPSANREALQQLAAEPAVHVAIVSGRALSDLRSRVPAPVTLVGNHGLELEREGKRAIHPVANKQSTGVATCCGLLETILEPLGDCRVEYKDLTGTVHLRSLPAGARRHVRTTVEQIVENRAGECVELSTGKDVLELRPAMNWGKGDAVELLLAREPAGTQAIYLGDDTTDEHAFATVEPDGLGILVGERQPSAASRRVDSPATVARLLEWLAEEGTAQLEPVTGANTGVATFSES